MRSPIGGPGQITAALIGHHGQTGGTQCGGHRGLCTAVQRALQGTGQQLRPGIAARTAAYASRETDVRATGRALADVAEDALLEAADGLRDGMSVGVRVVKAASKATAAKKPATKPATKLAVSSAHSNLLRRRQSCK